MGFEFKTNLKPATHAGIIWEFVDLLVRVGWDVPEWSDGATHDTTGIPPAQASDLNAANAWVRMREPEGIVGATRREWTFQRGPTAEEWRVKYSRAAGFVGGTPSASQTPSATDEYLILGGGTDAAPTFTALFQTTQGTSNVQMGASAVPMAPSGAYAFWLFTYRDGMQPDTLILQDPMQSGSYPVEDTDPVAISVLKQDGQILGGSFSAVGFLQFLNLLVPARYENGSTNLLPGATAHSLSGRASAACVLWATTSNPGGVKGFSSIFRRVTPAQLLGSTLRATHGGEFAAFGHVLVPWEDVGTPPGNRDAGATDPGIGQFNLDDVGMLVPMPFVHQVSPAPGGDLAADHDTARFTPVTFAVANIPAGHDVVITVKFSGWFEVVAYRGGVFTPMFDDESTRTGDVFSLLPRGGWPASVEVWVGAAVEAKA